MLSIGEKNIQRGFLNENEIRALIKEKDKFGFEYCVYELWRIDKNQPFYVGKGKRTRMFYHESEAYHKNCKRYLKSSLIRKFHKLNLSIKFSIDNFYIDEKEAFDREVELIKKYGRIDLETGCLANHSDGGEGLSNLSEETRERIRQSHIGKRLTEEHKEKISKAIRGRKQSEEEKKKRADAVRLYHQIRREAA